MAERENVSGLEFKWGQKMGVDCLEKEAQCYKSFKYDGIEYNLYDCVYMDKEGEPEPYIGKLIGIWETADKIKKVNVQWFFRPSEILNWLGDQTPMQKEIFLATGEGIGLSNVNTLEAIAGKCHVVCTSKDSRNILPSEEETIVADHIFFRTFDVGRCTILDEMGDSVGGLEVKYVFNREESRHMSSLQTNVSSKVEVASNTVACKGNNKLLMPNSSDEFELFEAYGHHDKSVVTKDVKGISVKSGWIPGGSSEYKTGSHSNMLTLTNEQQQKNVCASGQRVKLSEVNSMMGGVKKVINNKFRAKEKVRLDALQDKPTKKARIFNSSKQCEDMISNSAKNFFVEGDNSKMPAFTCNDQAKSDDKNLRLKRGDSVAKKGGSMKDGPIGITKDWTSNQAKKIVTSNNTNAKDFIKSDNHVEITSGIIKDSPTFKEHTRKLSNNNMSHVCEINNGEMEQKVAPRSDIDKGKWYSAIDIIKDALRTSCVAIKLPRTRMSSPHSGQALLMFNNYETAERVYEKITEGCLMLPNGRPLVATAAPPLNSAKGRRTFFGHLLIDSIKLQGDARYAVSTSHCSQPNTIEYEMAMEWCLLQAQSDRYWENLHELHGKEMRRLKANLKSK